MALNKDILIKLDKKTSNDPFIKEVILEILKFEVQENRWYEREYLRILEHYCKEDNNEI